MPDLLSALCLVLVIEGLLPFASPRNWREAMLQIARLDDKTLRVIGAACMVSGLVLLQVVQSAG